MIIVGRVGAGAKATAIVNVSSYSASANSSSVPMVSVDVDGTCLYLDANHAEALETAIRAARLEVLARERSL